MLKNYIKKTLFVGLIFGAISANAQCPQITCPDDIVVTTDPNECGAVVNYEVPVGINSCIGDETEIVFNYTGSVQTYVVPDGVWALEVEVVGAGGGWNDTGGSQILEHVPGTGGVSEAVLDVTPGQTLYFYVGGKGGDATNGVGGAAGYNGGGAGGTTGGHSGGGGGGASDIRTVENDLNSRIIVAGGGGGSAYNYTEGDNGGNGGGLEGANGESNYVTTDVSCGYGGTQFAGGQPGQWSGYEAGTAGQFGIGGNGANGTSGGGGGGGYYGGGGASWSGGGGGSGYIGNLLDATTNEGTNTDDGYIIITATDFDFLPTTFENGIGSGGFFPVGTTTETYSAIDEFGEIVTCSFTVTVQDNEGPEMTCPIDMEVTATLGLCGAIVQFDDPIVTDACGSYDYWQSGGLVSGSEFPQGSNIIEFTAEDEFGNFSSCSFEIYVEPNPEPTIVCPASIVATTDPELCGAIVEYGQPVVGNTCGFSIDEVTNFGYTGDFQLFNVPAGVFSIEVELYGASGGISTFGTDLQTQHVPGNGGQVNATIAVNPGDLLYVYVGGRGEDGGNGIGGNGGFNGGANGGTTGTYSGGGGGGATDIRLNGMALSNRILVAGGGGGSAYNYTEGDNGGNGGGLEGANGESNFYTSDVSCGTGGTQIGPGLGGQWVGYDAGADGALGEGGFGANGTSGGGGGGGYYGGGGGSWSGGGGGSNYQGTATDVAHFSGTNNGDGYAVFNISGSLVTTEVTIGPESGSMFDVGTTQVMITATNTFGNTTSCVFSVDVVDIEAPEILCVNDITSCTPSEEFLTPIINDNCTNVIYSYDITGATVIDGFGDATGTEFESGVSTVTYTVTDAGGNQATCSFEVNATVLDVEVSQNDNILTVNEDNATYQWFDCDTGEDIVGAVGQSYTVLIDSGSFGVTVDSQGCTVDSECFEYEIVSIGELEQSQVVVYPNPADNLLNVTFADIDVQQIVIVDALGQFVDKIDHIEASVHTFDVTQLDSGVYFVRVQTSQDWTVIPFVVSK